MIDMKAMLADREAGTQGPWFVRELENFGYNIVQYIQGNRHDLYRIAKTTFEADANRIARVPNLEQALIDDRAALKACRNLFTIMIRDHDDEETIDSSKIMLAICKKGLGE